MDCVTGLFVIQTNIPDGIVMMDQPEVQGLDPLATTLPVQETIYILSRLRLPNPEARIAFTVNSFQPDLVNNSHSGITCWVLE